MKLYYILTLSLFTIFCRAQESRITEIRFFGQVGFNQPIDRTINTGSGHFSVHFKPGFDAFLGISRTKKAVLSAQAKYTYTNGKYDGKEVYKTGDNRTIAAFYLGRVSGELSLACFLNKKRTLTLGFGILAGTCVYKNTSGTVTYPNTSGMYYGPYTSVIPDTTEKLRNNFIRSKHIGLSMNMNYDLQNTVTKLPVAVGLKTSVIYGMIPYLNSYLDCELNFTYTFSKKIKQPVTKPAESPVNWNGQYDNN